MGLMCGCGEDGRFVVRARRSDMQGSKLGRRPAPRTSRLVTMWQAGNDLSNHLIKTLFARGRRIIVVLGFATGCIGQCQAGQSLVLVPFMLQIYIVVLVWASSMWVGTEAAQTRTKLRNRRYLHVLSKGRHAIMWNEERLVSHAVELNGPRLTTSGS
ncbi:hypothetical protein LY78DRAFT_72157 [Colletotrichum sublineola]|nr:hypothetical protein LY78DRAFT_72157 [Colletotrichum sublineola]